jgi:2-iminobutanoate/2-iminopropanoate deaminase
MIKKINTTNAPAAIGPYSQAIAANGFLFTSGQIPLSPKTMKVVDGGIEEQTEQVIQNLRAILSEHHLSLEQTVKTTCYLANMDDFDKFNLVYEKYFTGKPARSCIAVKTLPKNVLCEIELVAALK